MDSAADSLWARIGGLWSALAVQKAAVLVFSFFVGHRLGLADFGLQSPPKRRKLGTEFRLPLENQFC